MKDKLIICTFVVLLFSVSFIVPLGIVTVGHDTESRILEEQHELAQATVVLIDESHIPGGGFTHDDGLANLTSDLEAHGYSVENMSTWSESLLFSAHVVVIPVPMVEYSLDEYYVLERFVAKGGGLFIIGDNPTGTTADELANEFDFSFYQYYLQDNDDYVVNPFWIQWDRVSNFGNHPITDGVSSVSTYLGFGINSYPGVAVPILMMDADDNSEYSTGFLSCGTAAIVASEYATGLGRIVVAGDIHQFGAGDVDTSGTIDYYQGDNDLLARNIIHWLADATIPENIIVFDETHNPLQSIDSLATNIEVVFDETQSPFYQTTSTYNILVSYLEGNNLDTAYENVFDPIDFSGAEVIVLGNPQTTYPESQAIFIMSEVARGAGLLLIGDAGTVLGMGAVQIAEQFGVEFYDGGLNDTDDYYDSPNRFRMDGSNLAEHPSLNGVHEVGYIYGSGFRTVPDNAVTILSTDDDSSSGWTDEPPGSPSPRDVPCAIAFQYGAGRVMMIADGGMFTATYLGHGNNSLFAISAMRWLAQGKSLRHYWYGAQALRNQGYGVMSMKQFNATVLEGTDALILPVSMDPYLGVEKTIIEEYVTVDGNGLFLIGEASFYGDDIRDIATDYGIYFDSLGTTLEDEDDYASTSFYNRFLLDSGNIQTHAITQGVEGLLWAEGVAIGSYPGNAEVILQMDNDAYSEWSNGTPALQEAMMVTLETGNGRVVALGDSTFWTDYNYYFDNYGDNHTMAVNELDNSRIMVNAVTWLIGEGGGPVLPFDLPWWALPAVGGVVAVLVLGVALRKRSGGKKTTRKKKTTTKRKTKTKTKKK
ncbi:MAG: hypothetical protein RTV41_07935 [Candidatus Thorarchaeota archaeon]